ncbi:MBL fold metallo-hydrolase [Streptomyces sp. NPDC014991]|uniref:MBL fold metallo-hydrolase n=1 Tax=Streptomyces sp. NPDC014991 TaxID=3364935 RepID=UPI0036F96E19
MVDAGRPAHVGQLREHLADSGRSVTDVRAVLLTHGHPDHTGLAHTFRQGGADVRGHRQDAACGSRCRGR